jgi:hypothetical protein
MAALADGHEDGHGEERQLEASGHQHFLGRRHP